MLVLTRKRKESIMVGSEIEIKVIAIEGDQVKIGIDAPKTVEVHRKEVFEAIQEENQQASSVQINRQMLKKMSSQLEKNKDNIKKP